jgi:Lrp/AsnC family transcriptional regulator, leucine-responsive regulatory protein
MRKALVEGPRNIQDDKAVATLDARDRKLLYLLDVDARMSYSALAKKLRVSKQVARYRVERLEREGFIKGYYPMIDTSRLGYITFRVYFKFRNLTPTIKAELIAYLKAQEEAWAVVTFAGRWDVGLGVSVPDIYAFYIFWDAFLTMYLPHVRDYKVCVYSPIYHYAKAYLTGEPDSSKVRILGGKERAEHDELDLKILSGLVKKTRASLLELARIVGKTPETVKYRLVQLERKGIIQGYRALIDVERLGYHYFKTEIRLSRYDHFKQLLEYCQRHPNIYQVDRTIGGETVEVEFHVKSVQEMLAIIEEFERQFPNTIESFDYLTLMTEEKVTYMPEAKQ